MRIESQSISLYFMLLLLSWWWLNSERIIGDIRGGCQQLICYGFYERPVLSLADWKAKIVHVVNHSSNL
jgi:hypothetical protein